MNCTTDNKSMGKNLLLGYDIGTSSIKASLIDSCTGICVGSASYPEQEMSISTPQPGWAEQNPETWWSNLISATKILLQKHDAENIKAIGISYQMHGLVLVDKDKNVLRPSIIWCDSRAVETGESAFNSIGKEKCLSLLLNSPSNFTASKLKWVKENEPHIYDKAFKFMLPGDYIAMKMTGDITTTVSGLSEGMMWNFKNDGFADFLFEHYQIDKSLVPDIVSTFSEQGKLSKSSALELGLNPGTKITYRAGDQPNNALSLNVTSPGEIAATAGTSGVIYGISEEVKYDDLSRVNTFAHVNHSSLENRLGILLCINGTGSMNNWLKNNIGGGKYSYEEMNKKASEIPVGSDNLLMLPFGNGAERIFENKDINCSLVNLNFNIHTNAHIFRAAQEGIVFAFKYGMDIMKDVGMSSKVIRAGNANMFLSPIFRQTLSNLTSTSIELYDTDGAQGAARGAGIGAKYYPTISDAFKGLKKIKTIEPENNSFKPINEAYQNWKVLLEKQL